MAKYESRLRGNFDELLNLINHGILKGSISASYEDGSDYSHGDVRCAVRVYERYSMMKGGNRVSMSITLVGAHDELFVTVITAGGSGAMFFKINTVGEHTFLNKAIDIIEGYKNRGFGGR